MGWKVIIVSLGDMISKIIKSFAGCKCHSQCCESDCSSSKKEEEAIEEI